MLPQIPVVWLRRRQRVPLALPAPDAQVPALLTTLPTVFAGDAGAATSVPKPARPTAASPLSKRNIAFFASLAALWTAVLCLRDHYIFTTTVYENGDAAANSILIGKAVHFRLLVGNYSREGFNHPGPALLYVESFGQDIFYALLHVVPSRYNGQIIGIYILNSILLSLTAIVLYRHSRNYSASVAGILVVLWLTNSHTLWASSWMPYVYVAPFLLAVVAGASVASGAVRDLPLYVLATALLVHGHICFVAIMGVYSLLVIGAWALLHRGRPKTYREVVGTHRAAFGISAALILVFLFPMVLQVVLHWPGPWGQYLRYATSNASTNPHSTGQALGYMAQFWPGGLALNLGLVSCGLVSAGVLLVARQVRARRFLALVLFAVVLMTAEVTWYGQRGVDFFGPTYAYTGYFYYVVPPLLLCVTLLLATEFVRDSRWWRRMLPVRARAWWQQGQRLQRAKIASALGALSCVILLGFTQVNFVNVYRGEPDLNPMTAAVHDAAARHGRTAVAIMGAFGPGLSEWPVVIGVVVQASHTRLPMCVAYPGLAFLFSGSNICTPLQVMRGYEFTVEGLPSSAPPGWAVLWHDSKLVVYAKSSPRG
jgi:hypothetical protein